MRKYMNTNRLCKYNAKFFEKIPHTPIRYMQKKIKLKNLELPYSFFVVPLNGPALLVMMLSRKKTDE